LVIVIKAVGGDRRKRGSEAVPRYFADAIERTADDENDDDDEEDWGRSISRTFFCCLQRISRFSSMRKRIAPEVLAQIRLELGLRSALVLGPEGLWTRYVENAVAYFYRVVWEA
jgi:hypothetical protein